MGEIKGFLKIRRQEFSYRPVQERIKDFKEVAVIPCVRFSQEQAGRCMDCSTSFCHWACPLGNYIPEWNDLMFKGHWKEAFFLLQGSNNFPEFTGRLCPAICEYACVLGVNDEPVTVRQNELSIIEYAFAQGWIKAHPPKKRTGRRVAIIGSGPAGLTAADQLNKAGHKVVIFEREKKPGGILRYGIPDFKLEKWVIDRRVEILKQEGIEFREGIEVGVDWAVEHIKEEFDVLCLAGGAKVPRDLKVEGRELKGIYFAMEYLTQVNKKVAGEDIEQKIKVEGKRVVVIGGGDTGADCVGTAHREGAKSVLQIEILPKPPQSRPSSSPWPYYPQLLKTSSSHQEGGERMWSVLTKRFIGRDGWVKRISCSKVRWRERKGKKEMEEIPESSFEIPADVVILAIGFAHPEHKGPISALNLQVDKQGNVATNDQYQTSVEGVFSAGDMRRGQSLIVWAISEGREVAKAIDKYLMGE